MALMCNNNIDGIELKPLGIKFRDFQEVKMYFENFDFISNGFILRYKQMTFGNKSILFINNDLVNMELIM